MTKTDFWLGVAAILCGLCYLAFVLDAAADKRAKRLIDYLEHRDRR